MVKRLTAPLRDVDGLEVGDVAYISGTIYTVRDRGLVKLVESVGREGGPPIDLNGAVIYHSGPIVRRVRGSWTVVSAGPTTSARMGGYDAVLISLGVKGIIGKGRPPDAVRDACRRYGAVYMVYPGGCGALAARSVKEVVNVYWEELGMAEAVWALKVEGLGPLYVAVDSRGRDYFRERAEEVRRAFREVLKELGSGLRA